MANGYGKGDGPKFGKGDIVRMKVLASQPEMEVIGFLRNDSDMVLCRWGTGDGRHGETYFAIESLVLARKADEGNKP